MSVMSTGRRPGAVVRRLSPEDAYLLPRRPGPAGSNPAAARRPGRPRLRLVPPLPAGPAGNLSPAPPRGRTSASADARVPAPRAGSVPPAARAPMSTPAAMTAPARRPAGHGQVRLTRRGRLVVWALAALTAAAVLIPVWLLAAGGAQAANHGLPPAAVHAGLRQVIVRPGQTLWSIATATKPSGNLWPVIQQIINVNALSSANVQAGQLLWVPRS